MEFLCAPQITKWILSPYIWWIWHSICISYVQSPKAKWIYLFGKEKFNICYTTTHTVPEILPSDYYWDHNSKLHMNDLIHGLLPQFINKEESTQLKLGKFHNVWATKAFTSIFQLKVH